jgi:hypothetical protein
MPTNGVGPAATPLVADVSITPGGNETDALPLFADSGWIVEAAPESRVRVMVWPIPTVTPYMVNVAVDVLAFVMVNVRGWAVFDGVGIVSAWPGVVMVTRNAEPMFTVAAAVPIGPPVGLSEIAIGRATVTPEGEASV